MRQHAGAPVSARSDSRPEADAAVYVCGLAGLDGYAARLEPEGLVSLVEAQAQPPTPTGVCPTRHLRLAVDDIATPLPGHVLAREEHVAALLDFARDWRAERPLLIHCAAGISRSTAAALACLGLRSGEHELALARRLRRAAPHAHPNRRIVALADALLGRDGRLVAAVEAMGLPRPVLEGRLVRLPLVPG